MVVVVGSAGCKAISIIGIMGRKLFLDRKGLMGWVCLSVCHAYTAALGKPYV
jgi:hypothetical protein